MFKIKARRRRRSVLDFLQIPPMKMFKIIGKGGESVEKLSDMRHSLMNGNYFLKVPEVEVGSSRAPLFSNRLLDDSSLFFLMSC